MRRITSVPLAIALLATPLFVGCGENAAEDKPAAITGPARPEPAPGDPAVAEDALSVASAEPTPDDPAPEAGGSTRDASDLVPATFSRPVLTFSGADGSTIGFIGSNKLGGSHDGGFKDFAGTMTLSADESTIAGIEATIAMDSTWADDPKLTDHLKSEDFFDVSKYDESRFVATAIEPGGEEGATHTVTGNFTLHGVTKSITFPATVAVTPEKATLTSEFSIDRNDFGITYSALIRPDVVIKLNLDAARVAGS